MALFIGNGLNLGKTEIQNAVAQNLASPPSSPVEGQFYLDTTEDAFGVYQNGGWAYLGAGGGTVTDVTVVTANGFAGTVANASTSPDITLTTTITGLLKGNGTAISAATSGTDYVIPSGSVATLTTPRAIYGNNFDGSAALAQIIASTYGGTGNGFTKFTGPATSEKTFTLPNASATILTDNSVVTVPQGGTGVATLTGLVKGNGTSAFSAAVAGTDYLTGSSSNELTNKAFDANGTGNTLLNVEVADFAANVVDTDGTMAANSASRIPSQSAVVTYVQANAQGVKWKDAVRVATTAAGTLATSFENGDSIDGVTLATGDRILIKNQSSGSENGIYVVAASGAPTRAVDANTGTEIKSMVTSVQEGTVNADTAWILTNDGTITLDTTALTYTNFISANVPTASTTVEGKVELATQAEAQAKTDTTRALTAASVADFARKYTGLIGDGSTTAIAVTHGLGSQYVTAQVFDASTNAMILVDTTLTSSTQTTFTFAVAPASNAYRVVITG